MKKTSDVQIKLFLLMFLNVVRALKRVEFEVKILCDFQNREKSIGFYRETENEPR